MTEQQNASQWKRMRFKRNKVWLAVDETQQPVVENGKVLIKYQLDQPHQYHVYPSSVRPLDDERPESAAADHPSPRRTSPPQMETGPSGSSGAIRIYTDGACSGNPGPAGIGVVMTFGERRKELSNAIGLATNNVAELEAIRQGLAAVKNRKIPVKLYTDSEYAIGVLRRQNKSYGNRELVMRIRRLLDTFEQVEFIKVRGHAGHAENERADRLAVQAIMKKKAPSPSHGKTEGGLKT